MHDESHTLIIELIKTQSDSNIAQMKAIQKDMSVGFDLLAAEMREITEQKKIQNGRVDKLEKVTWINRTVIKYPKTSIFCTLVGYFGLMEIGKFITISDIIKKYLP